MAVPALLPAFLAAIAVVPVAAIAVVPVAVVMATPVAVVVGHRRRSMRAPLYVI